MIRLALLGATVGAHIYTQGVSAGFTVFPSTYCGVGTAGAGELSSCTCKKGGACAKAPGANAATGTNYGFMGDLSLQACEAK